MNLSGGEMWEYLEGVGGGEPYSQYIVFNFHNRHMQTHTHTPHTHPTYFKRKKNRQ